MIYDNVPEVAQLAGVTVAIDDCYEVWASGIISIPWDFSIQDLKPQLLRLLGSGPRKPSDSAAPLKTLMRTSANLLSGRRHGLAPTILASTSAGGRKLNTFWEGPCSIEGVTCRIQQQHLWPEPGNYVHIRIAARTRCKPFDIGHQARGLKAARFHRPLSFSMNLCKRSSVTYFL